MSDFTARIHEEDGSYWAEVVELPGCFASADTIDELKQAIEEAVSLYLSSPDRARVDAKMTEMRLKTTA